MENFFIPIISAHGRSGKKMNNKIYYAKILLGIFLLNFYGKNCLDVLPISGKCTPRGIELNLAPNVRQVRVCVRPICLEKSNPDAFEKFNFPRPILLYSQQIDISYWIGDTKLTL